MAQSTIARTRSSRTGVASPKASKKSFRPDIQGLRAIAVLAVIADHLFGYPAGGFVGVDIFFVLSGFLITGLLIREYDRTGRISFADFYRRRIRRIMPLAATVIVFTVGVSWALYATGRAVRITGDGVWSLLFGMNWHLALEGTDYMQAGAAVTPLQHFWSLAVEEQFYVVWPWLIILLLGVLPRTLKVSGGHKAILGIGMLVVSMASLLWALWETAALPTFAYFSTFSRAWELGVGALVAVASTQLSRIPNLFRPVLAYLGLAGILWSAFFITSDMAFPGPWAVVPVLSTALVVAANVGGEARSLAPITNPVARYLGNISYSLYLWHFPVIILLEDLLGDTGPIGYTFAIILTFSLSAWSFHFIEDPIRHSSWLESKSSGRKSADQEARNKMALSAIGALGVATILLCSLALQRTAPIEMVAGPVRAPVASESAAASKTPAADALAQKIGLALSTPRWPDLTPSIDAIGPESKVPEWVQDGCLGDERGAQGTPEENATRCVYGDPQAAKTAVVLGDSISISYVPAIRKALEPQGYKILVYTMQQCPAVDVEVMKGDKSEHPDCAPFREWTTQQVQMLQPDMVLASSALGTIDRLASGATGSTALAEWTAGSKALFKSLEGATPSLIVLDAPPGGRSLTECATKVSSPSDCATKVDQRFIELAAAGRAALDADTAWVHYIDSRAWFCSSGICPAFVDNTPIYADGSHLIGNYSETLGPVLAESLSATLQ